MVFLTFSVFFYNMVVSEAMFVNKTGYPFRKMCSRSHFKENLWQGGQAVAATMAY